MVDLTKSVSIAQNLIQKTASQIATPKTTETVGNVVGEASSKLAEDIKKIDVIAECAKAQSMANIPDYVYNIARHLNR